MINDTQQKLKIALIVDSNISSKYVYELACWAQNQINLEITSLIIQKTWLSSSGKFKRGIESLRKKGILVLLDQIGYTFLVKLESLLLKRNKTHKDHFNQYNLFDHVDEVIKVEPIISKSGFVYRYSANDIKKNKTAKFRCFNSMWFWHSPWRYIDYSKLWDYFFSSRRQ